MQPKPKKDPSRRAEGERGEHKQGGVYTSKMKQTNNRNKTTSVLTALGVHLLTLLKLGVILGVCGFLVSSGVHFFVAGGLLRPPASPFEEIFVTVSLMQQEFAVLLLGFSVALAFASAFAEFISESGFGFRNPVIKPESYGRVVYLVVLNALFAMGQPIPPNPTELLNQLVAPVDRGTVETVPALLGWFVVVCWIPPFLRWVVQRALDATPKS